MLCDVCLCVCDLRRIVVLYFVVCVFFVGVIVCVCVEKMVCDVMCDGVCL